MKRFLTAVAVSALVLVPAGAAQAASSPVPGRYCKAADFGKKIKTPKYGLVVCKKDGSRARWARG